MGYSYTSYRKINRWDRLWNSFVVDDCSIRVSGSVFCFLREMPELLLMHGVALTSLISRALCNRSKASLLAEVPAHYSKFLVRHLPHGSYAPVVTKL